MNTDTTPAAREAVEVISQREAMEILRVNRQSIYNMIKRGLLTPRGYGHRNYFLREEVQQLLIQPKQ